MNKPIAFFPTSNIFVKKMIQLNNFLEDDIIFESGFGQGAFIEELEKNGFKNIYGIEFSNDLFNEVFNKFNNNKLFQGDYLSFKPNFKIDHIIGNPPYISSKYLDINMKDNIRNITGMKECNIYYAFIIHSINILKDGGSLTYILPYDFFYNSHAMKLRKYMIEHGYFSDIIDLKESKIFKDASPEIIIFRYIKSSIKNKPKINIKILKKEKENLSNFINNWEEIFEEIKIDNFDNDDEWALSNRKKINGTMLKDIKGVKVSVGIVNGSENNFIIKNNNFLDKLNSFEKNNLVSGFIKNKHRNNNSVDTENFDYYIFIPNNIFISEEEFKTKAPNVYNFLYQNKEVMLKRKLNTNRMWWDYLAIRNKDVFEKNKNKLKIHVPTITRLEKEWFFLTKNDKYVGGDLLTITSDNEELLINIFHYLNSNFFNEYYKELGARKGNRIIFTQKILSETIIPFEVIKYLNAPIMNKDF